MTEKKFKHIAAGKEYGIWAAEATDGTIQTIYGDAGFVGWVEDQQGKADVVAASDWNNMWCVNKDGEIWHFKDGDILWSAGTWTRIATASGRNDAKTISVGHQDGSVWYVQKDGRIFRRDGNSWTPDAVGRAETIAAANRHTVWAVNKDGQLWRRVSSGWSQEATHSGRNDVQSVAVGPNGTVAYIDTNGVVFSRPPEVGAWKRVWDQQDMGKAAVLAMGYEDSLACLNTKGEVWFVRDSQAEKCVEVLSNQWIYTVKAGDQLNKIVMREFGLKNATEITHMVDYIVAQNGIEDRNHIKVGDVLRANL